MTSITSTRSRSETAIIVRLFGLACMVGGLLWWLLNASEPFGIPLGPPVVGGVIGVVLLVGLTGGPLGLLALRATGHLKMGLAGTTITMVGLISYLTGQLLQTAFGFATQEIGIFYAAGALLVGLGTLLLGIAVTLARRLAGWRRFAPLFVGLYYAAMIPVQVVFFIRPDGAPSNTLLAFWGLTWALLGWAIFSSASELPQATRR
jgi:hypothetical protein